MNPLIFQIVFGSYLKRFIPNKINLLKATVHRMGKDDDVATEDVVFAASNERGSLMDVCLRPHVLLSLLLVKEKFITWR